MYIFSEQSIQFTDVVLQQIHQRLLAEEDKLANQNSNQNLPNWVPKEAAELKYLPGYGTFSEALVCCVEEKVKPIFGDLILEMDFNNNLMLIVKDSSYFMDMWLSLFKYFCSKPYNWSTITNPIGKCYFPFSQQMMTLLDTFIDEITQQTGSCGKFSNYFKLIHFLLLSKDLSAD